MCNKNKNKKNWYFRPPFFFNDYCTNSSQQRIYAFEMFFHMKFKKNFG